MPIAPTLLVGLGGTGSQIIEKVYTKLRETNSSQSERISFVAFDTDINDLKDLKRRNPTIHTVQTSTAHTVGEYLDQNKQARDVWFPLNTMLNRKPLTEGAAQVRAISRLAFETTLRGGRLQRLHDAVDDLFRINADQEEQALRITIASSLAGGTGSGLILPVAMYLADYLRRTYPMTHAITRGFFIQPDVFYAVIPAAEEQRNLQVNAYAALRELDAFLMKGDNTLDAQYQNLNFTFPSLSGDGVIEVEAMPYDFCFLFGSTNTFGGGLDSFASYKDHAATCIYTQSIGPMSKRQNSREDNVLREVIKNDGRNRYAGAGASRLVYDWQHVQDYVALKWASQALSTQWLTFDDMVKKLQEAQTEQKEGGFAVKDLDRGAEYVKLIESADSRKEPFARLIVAQCWLWDKDSLNKELPRWTEYLQELQDFVVDEARDKADPTEGMNARIMVSNLSNTAASADYEAAYYDLKRFRDLTQRRVEEYAGVMAYSLFRSEQKSITKDGHAHLLETYLREKSSGDFLHPVAARYFLYSTLRELQAAKQEADTDLAETIDYLDSFPMRLFPSKNPSEAGQPSAWASAYRKSVKERLRDKPGRKLQRMITADRAYIERVETYRDQYMWAEVLKEAITYVKGMCATFEVLFDQLDGRLKALDSDIDQKLRQYDDLKGSTTRYVLGDSRSLAFMHGHMPYRGKLLALDSDLCEDIYVRVRNYHMLRDEKDASYFDDLYKDRMLGYFRGKVMETYQTQIQIDIIQALEAECRALDHQYRDADVTHYVVGEIDKAKRLAAPFIEHPLGEERHPIISCAYNPALKGTSDPRRISLVAEHLGNYGGQEDGDISPHEILFYNAIYSIKARDLSMYAPPQHDVTVQRPAGVYFSSYYHLVSQLTPDPTEARVITPHIDRRWHTIVALPDLDEANAQAQFRRVCSAFFGGLTLGVINRNTIHGDQKVYQYKPGKGPDKRLATSNGSPCDRFYEVFDAIAINPVATTEIMESLDRRRKIFCEETPAPTFAQSPLAKALNAPHGLDITELSEVVPGMEGRVVTLLDVPVFYALSAPNDEVSDLMIYQMTSEILNYLGEQITLVEDPSQVEPVIEEMLTRNFDIFKGNAKAYLELAGDSFAGRVRAVLRGLYQYVDARHLRQLATEVEALEDSLRRGTEAASGSNAQDKPDA